MQTNLNQTPASIKDLFGIEGAEKAMVMVREKDEACGLMIPQADPDYFFEPKLLKKILMFINPQTPTRNAMFFGPTGAGKTSVLLQVCARLNIPVAQMACSGKTRFDHLTGSRDLVNGNTVFTYGPLTSAMLYPHGALCLLDEVTRMDPDEQMAMAPVLDSGRLMVKENGQVVTAAPGFRLVATGNSNGTGDDTGMYGNEKIASAAFTDRFLKIGVSYLDAGSEAQVIGRVVKSVTGTNTAMADALLQMVPQMVQFANQIRTTSSGGPGMRIAISTRNLINWIRVAVAYRRMNIDNNMTEALSDTILNGAPADESRAVLEIWQRLMNGPGEIEVGKTAKRARAA